MTDRTSLQFYEELAVRLAGRSSAGGVRTLWRHLVPTSGEPVRFDPSRLSQLPEPARRWLAHSLLPGTPEARAVALRMRGHIRVGRWLPFSAIQLHVPPDGYLWVAKAGAAPITIRGYDFYTGGAGGAGMRWRLFGRVPVVHASGPDVERSAAGRVALDAFLLPSSWLGPQVSWQPGPDTDSAVAHWQVGSWLLRVCIDVGPDGALRAVSMPRWAAPLGEPWGEYSCGGTLSAERRFDGVTVPTESQAGTSSARLAGRTASSFEPESPTPVSGSQNCAPAVVPAGAQRLVARSDRWRAATDGCAA